MTLPVFGSQNHSSNSGLNPVQKSSLEEINDFIIDPSRITKITTENYVSYTAVIKRNTPNNVFFENIVVMKWKNKPEPQAFLIKYTPSSKIKIFDEHHSFSFEGKRSIKAISLEENYNYKTSDGCGTIYKWWCDYSFPHVAGPECFKATDDRVYLKPVPDESCTETGTFDGSEGGSTNYDSGTDGPETTLGGGGTATGEEEPVITLPMYPDGTSASSTFLINKLGITNSRQIDFLNNNPEISGELLSFYVEKGSTLEAKTFLKETVRALVFNPSFDIDLERSFISPYKIDLSHVQPGSMNADPAKVKFMYIYDKLLETSFFEDVITKVFGNPSTKMNVTFKIVEDLSVGEVHPNGSTEYSIITGGNALVDNSITINIDKDYLINQPLIRIAKTMVHEVVHTHLALVNINSPYASIVGDYSTEDFARLLDEHLALKIDEHEFIAQHYIPSISNAVKEILPLLESQLRIDNIAEWPLFDMDGVSGLGAWNWEEFYKYISWSGLESTQYFDDLLEDGTLDQSLYLAYNRYSTYKSSGNNENRFSTESK